MNDLIFKIVEVAIYVLIAATFRYLIPTLVTHLKHSKYSFIADIITDAVNAAEQTIQGDGLGADKKKKVVEYAYRACEKYGAKLTEEQIDTIIEAAVRAMKAEVK